MADTTKPEEGAEFEGLTLKEKGNKLFSQHKFTDAIRVYTEAIEQEETAVLYSNRAFCWLKVDMYGAAKLDADKAIALDPNYAKGYYRRATAKYSLAKYKSALADFKQVCKLAPKDRGARERYTECDKMVKRLAFERAIIADEGKPVSETINLEEMAQSESSYKGLAQPWPLTPQYILDLKEEFRQEKKIAKSHVFRILLEFKKIMEKEKSIIYLDIPEEKPADGDNTGTSKEGHVVVWGDIHGQYYDMLNILDKTGMPTPGRKLVFNGDFVDRGSFSCEVVILLFAMKVCYPDLVFLNRGNHETSNMNRVYGFMGEAKAKYGELSCDLFREVFNWLPLAHVIQKKVFVTHGGLFQKDDITLEELEKIDRNREPSDPSPMAEMLWSDPQPFSGRSPSKRGIGLSFGPDVTKNFLKKNNLELIIRSHEVKPEGYEINHDGKCITVFSAPNYCDEVGNKAAVVTLTKDLKPKMTQFTHVPHPKSKPMQYAMNMG
eukprot:CAMPEP_0201508452 /NCGR_PEP_ID=MMETSP0161_2-20130828/1822_1 /ASSEMBLY_ACC=CAM_ASM_000251 /TAXON_ID=180227 /ORGANISM="Neoparamoeba aestuarina, Strain SoJaBio B1-5/56/2" /LENGTH=491 /DNA_ID=CAMNT_0047903127 /DNA_START=77 /DNA_END=1548 /DNA_ORIENTATION=-